MKKIIVIAAVLTIVLWAECFAQKKGKGKADYDFPEAMGEPVRAAFRPICDKGQILYEINCARCHNITEGKKSIIPDFTTEQLIGYELRVSNPKHESEMPETMVSAEELGQITTFLTYKKKSGVAMTKKPTANL